MTPELRAQLEAQREQLRLQEEAINQLLATDAPHAVSTSTGLNGLQIDTQMARGFSQHSRAAPATMSRVASSTSSCPATQPMTGSRRATVASAANHQRSVHHAYSTATPDVYSTSLPSTVISTDLQHTVMSPYEFISSQPSYQNSSKRFRTASTPGAMCPPPRQPCQQPRDAFLGTISPDLLSTSFRTQSSPSAHPLSRQSSVAGCSTLGEGLDMMRLMSDTSYTQSQAASEPCPEQFAFDDFDQAAGLSSIPVMPSNAATWGSNESQPMLASDARLDLASEDNLLCQIGSGCAALQSQAVELADDIYLGPVDMSRSASNGSNCSTMSAQERKAHQRNQRHIENAKQAIKPKSETATGTSTAQGKQAIAKLPYTRPKHPKQFCNLCEERPDGFHGVHELRRHQARAHNAVRKAWICTQPKTISDGVWPKRPLSACRQCQQKKTYNAYYNAAAHIRRSHFHPRKRGRRAKGEVQESRAGKAGGDDPSILWLKKNGWLKEVEVAIDHWQGSTEAEAPSDMEEDNETVFGLDAMFGGDADYSQQPIDSLVPDEQSFWRLQDPLVVS